MNDNLYKNALIVLLSLESARMSQLSADFLINLCAGIFILPFFLFSATAGQIADKYEKSGLIRWIKFFEIVVMGIAALGFYWHNLEFLLAALFFMGLHSTLFGPVKYAYLPQHLQKNELMGGNGVVDAGTFLAILLGTIVGASLMQWQPEGLFWVCFSGLAVALLGWGLSFAIPSTVASMPELIVQWNPLIATKHNLKALYAERELFLCVLGISWFWFYGATLLTQLPMFSKQALGGKEDLLTGLLVLFSVGVGIGSLLCERLNRVWHGYHWIVWGSVGLSVFTLDLYFATPTVLPAVALSLEAFVHQPSSLRIGGDLLMIGLSGGVYIVPFYTFLQSRSAEQHRSRVVAGNNIMNAFLMVVAADMAVIWLKAGFSIAQLFGFIAFLNVGVLLFLFFSGMVRLLNVSVESPAPKN